MDRQGQIDYPSNEKYQGDINQKGRHGKGKYYFKDGNWIEAQFENNNLLRIINTS